MNLKIRDENYNLAITTSVHSSKHYMNSKASRTMSDTSRISENNGLPVPLNEIESQTNRTDNRKPKKFIESDAGDGTRREDQYLHGIKLVFCMISIFLCLFLVALDQTIVVTLLTKVGNEFNSFDKIGWLASGFLLSMAVLTATWGKISIIMGRKVTMYVAIILFEIGSLICGLSNSMGLLIGGRVIAGIGGGGIQSLVFVIISEVIPIEKRPIGIAILASTFAVASVLGPLIGGAFTNQVTWRWCFYINLPAGSLALVFFFFSFNPPKPKGNLREKLKIIDYIGTVLLTGGLVVFLLALTLGAGSDYSWNSAGVISCFVVGGFVIILFIIWNFKFSKNQIIPYEIIAIPQVIASAVTFFAMFGYFMTVILYVSIYFQVIHGAGAWQSGVQLLALIIPVVISSLAGGGLMYGSGYVKPFSVAAGILGPIGCGLLTLLDVYSPSSQKIGLLIVVGVSCGFQMQAVLILLQLAAPKTPGGTILSTTFASFCKSLGGTIGADLADAVYSLTFKSVYKKAIAHQTNPDILSELKNIDAGVLVDSTELIQKLSPVTQHFVKVQCMHAIRNVYYMAIGFSVLAFISCLFTTNKKLPKESSGAQGAEEEEYKEDIQ